MPATETTRMKVIVDQEACVGCGLCADNCPEVFEMVDGVAKAKVEEVPAALEDKARDAASSCPVEAIKFTE